jgi:osmotically-inducible protein OsmY
MIKLKQRFALAIAAAVLGLAGCATSPGGNSFFDDAATTMRVKKAIYNEPSLKVMNVSVTTEDGVVDLSGKVKSKAERAKAAAIAAKVEGVKKVKNELTVE